MLIDCYYYAPHNHSLLLTHLREDLARMANLGCQAVSLCVQEGQLTNWHQQRLRTVVDEAHRAGLKVHAVPNRWAGLVAGWLDGFGEDSLRHLDWVIRTPDGAMDLACRYPVGCTQHPGVAEHVMRTLDLMLDRFAFDGVIWDEPRSPLVCHCARCRAAAPGGTPTAAWQAERTAAFFDRMSAHAKARRPGLTTALFVMPECGELLRACLAARHIDHLGSDGHLRSTGHRMHRMKRTIFEAYDEYAPLLAAAGRKSFFLIEAQRHRDEDLDDYLAQLERAFTLPMDHLMWYYSAHELSAANEDRFNEATWAMVRRIARG